MAEVLLGGKRLTELKVTELKAELDKRGLPKKGVKSVLVQRLKNAILKEALTQVSVPQMFLALITNVELTKMIYKLSFSQPEESGTGEDEGDESLLNNSQVRNKN